MRLLTRIATIGTLVAVGVGGPAVASAGASTPSRVVGHVYVNDNTAGVNTIAAFDRHRDGTLTATKGSPFAAGGAGTGQGIGSQGSLQVADHGKYLVAVDAGSNQLSVLRIKADGGLRAVPGGPVGSAGTEPVSIAIRPSEEQRHREHHDQKQLLYVANAGNGGSNYTGFSLGHTGRLRAIAHSTVALPDGSQPGDILFNRDGTRLAAARVGTSLIDSFAVDERGHLHAAPGSPFAAQGLGPFGSEFRPTNPDQLFVSNAHDGPGNGTVSAFRVSSNGTLTSIGSSPYPDRQTAPCWVEITHDGRYLFAVNTAVPSISRYSIARNGALTLLGSTPFNNPAGLAPVDAGSPPMARRWWSSMAAVGQ